MHSFATLRASPKRCKMVWDVHLDDHRHECKSWNASTLLLRTSFSPEEDLAGSSRPSRVQTFQSFVPSVSNSSSCSMPCCGLSKHLSRDWICLWISLSSVCDAVESSLSVGKRLRRSEVNAVDGQRERNWTFGLEMFQ